MTKGLWIMYHFEDLQKKHIKKLDDTISVAMKQTRHGQKISGDESYKKMKAKIKKIAQGK
ncbi:MAG: hypothetical protein COY58_01690 [Gammaproteobacteria bacterium CG_4_10_14_0_8_um_filter_38_16]|nr:MAG: hypothetical protein COY58_01690 [Gammaproteobacteria bacterium CG_4_10_14_0_8_um_filter_38_16]PJA03977.1 MAG: hypothetical protein COX72_02375 [Gammaproteobacteria bacterium CG_4_10_14_0_2_um_filter_38_22]PJB10553.1 MAG: hypothetical protein CO120_04300 [Gammaproteobacteria bacterium CG_4_9_14_3_um_filter_38_9]